MLLTEAAGSWPWLAGFSLSFLLVFAAEMGDKSQLVCMALTSKYRPVPVLIGATLAFMLLNALAILFGSLIASWLSMQWILLLVAVLFFTFGIQSLRYVDEEEEDIEVVADISILRMITSTFAIIAFAEFGDKTQLAVVGLSSNHSPLAVFIGATLALFLTSALGIWLGTKLNQYLSVANMHKFSGCLFLFFGGLAIYQFFQLIF